MEALENCASEGKSYLLSNKEKKIIGGVAFNF
jgi:hypothetical protein